MGGTGVDGAGLGVRLSLLTTLYGQCGLEAKAITAQRPYVLIGQSDGFNTGTNLSRVGLACDYVIVAMGDLVRRSPATSRRETKARVFVNQCE